MFNRITCGSWKNRKKKKNRKSEKKETPQRIKRNPDDEEMVIRIQLMHSALRPQKQMSQFELNMELIRYKNGRGHAGVMIDMYTPMNK